MLISQSWIGTRFPPHSATVEESRVRFFSKVTGQTNPIYFDADAARRAGYPSLVAPPTFIWCLAMDRPDPFHILNTIGADLSRVLHGGERLELKKMVFAGDSLTFSAVISDIFERKKGALCFVVEDTAVHCQAGELVCHMRKTGVIREPTRSVL